MGEACGFGTIYGPIAGYLLTGIPLSWFCGEHLSHFLITLPNFLSLNSNHFPSKSEVKDIKKWLKCSPQNRLSGIPVNSLINSYPGKWFRGEHLGSIWDICPLFLVPPSICLTIFVVPPYTGGHPHQRIELGANFRDEENEIRK